jgi:hypothetical protein
LRGQVIERHRIGNLQRADGDPAQGRQMRSASECSAQILGQAANIGAFAAGDPQADNGLEKNQAAAVRG